MPEKDSFRKKFWQKETSFLKLGVAFELQVVESFEKEKHDCGMDFTSKDLNMIKSMMSYNQIT